MRKIDSLLDAYGESHRDPLNRALHWFCIPATAWAAVALIWSIPFPWQIGAGIVPLNWAVIALIPVQIHYFRLARRLGMGLMLFSLSLLWLTAVVESESPRPLWQVALVVLGLAWILHVIGHRNEGARAPFPTDLRYPLIGPAWLLSLVYRRVDFEF